MGVFFLPYVRSLTVNHFKKALLSNSSAFLLLNSPSDHSNPKYSQYSVVLNYLCNNKLDPNSTSLLLLWQGTQSKI
ncbi:hypothetical protein Avbf_04688 [Armadillidium vulgare]|nr:hypothetical protein Avbf_04688 [Armadillidium vulgare]